MNPDLNVNFRWDGHVNGWLKADFLSKRALQGESFPGGTVNLLMGMMELKTILLHETSKCSVENN